MNLGVAYYLVMVEERETQKHWILMVPEDWVGGWNLGGYPKTLCEWMLTSSICDKHVEVINGNTENTINGSFVVFFNGGS